mmetsp:Transcript_98506/g.261754  ORF Transcript_98506/g.261754 Transcript_98506/m.261754 type:complete len:264 (-) Transcript_98506:906-1697(-)
MAGLRCDPQQLHQCEDSGRSPSRLPPTPHRQGCRHGLVLCLSLVRWWRLPPTSNRCLGLALTLGLSLNLGLSCIWGRLAAAGSRCLSLRLGLICGCLALAAASCSRLIGLGLGLLGGRLPTARSSLAGLLLRSCLSLGCRGCPSLIGRRRGLRSLLRLRVVLLIAIGHFSVLLLLVLLRLLPGRHLLRNLLWSCWRWLLSRRNSSDDAPHAGLCVGLDHVGEVHLVLEVVGLHKADSEALVGVVLAPVLLHVLCGVLLVLVPA